MLGRIRDRRVEILLIGARGTNMQPLAERYRIANDPQMRTQGVAHFNAAGYDQIVARMLPHVEQLIARLKR
jgi:hypothetical protein